MWVSIRKSTNLLKICTIFKMPNLISFFVQMEKNIKNMSIWVFLPSIEKYLEPKTTPKIRIGLRVTQRYLRSFCKKCRNFENSTILPTFAKKWKFHLRFVSPLLDIGFNRPPFDGEVFMIPSHSICAWFGLFKAYDIIVNNIKDRVMAL